MKRFLGAMALTSLLSVSVFAGDIPISGSPAPAGPGVTKSGDIPSGGKPGDVSTSGKSEQISTDALSAVLSVLSFLTR
jgi:hypothetical protein